MTSGFPTSSQGSPARPAGSAAPTSGRISRLPGWAPVDEIRDRTELRRSGKSRPQANRDRQFDRGSTGGRIYIELVNWPFLSEHKGSPAEYKAGLDLAIARGWLMLHESGTYLKFTQAGAELFA
jgi:hypothetical protein